MTSNAVNFMGKSIKGNKGIGVMQLETLIPQNLPSPVPVSTWKIRAVL